MKNRLYIIKIGSNIIEDNQNLDLFLTNFSQLKGAKILVHGGGKEEKRQAQYQGDHHGEQAPLPGPVFW